MVVMAIDHYGPYRWVQAPISALALWLIVSPFTLGSTSTALTWSDVLSGAATLGMSLLALERGLEGWCLVGAMIIVVAIIALAEVARPARFLSAPLGPWLMFAPWLLSGGRRQWGPRTPSHRESEANAHGAK
jgi:hypothetical protein